MAMGHKEDWPKPRKKNQHFTKEELKQVRALFIAGKSVMEAAREMQASTASIGAHYRRIKAEGYCQGIERKHSPANYTARLYKGSFDL